MSSGRSLSRREFLRTAGATAVGIAVSSVTVKDADAAGVPAPGRVIGANDRISIAMIGVGDRGGNHLRRIKNMAKEQNVAIVAVCDVWEKRRKEAQLAVELSDSAVFTDYRKVLENKDIDLCVISTPDHWHGPIAVAALEAGKHVYVEKPMTRHLDEALKLHETAKRTGKLVQVGAQGCSEPKWHRAGELVNAGRIGTLLWAESSYCRNTPTGEWNVDIDPDLREDNVDWKLWLGDAPKQPFSPERYFRWRKYWDYGSGIIGDLWPHRLYPLVVAMGKAEFPKRVACMGGSLTDSDANAAPKREVPDASMMMAELDSGRMMYLTGTTVNEQGTQDVIRGNKATMYFGGDKVQIKPERPYSDEIEGLDDTCPTPADYQKEHHRDLFRCIRNGGTPRCSVDLGLRVQVILSLAEQSCRESRMMGFDTKRLAAT